MKIEEIIEFVEENPGKVEAGMCGGFLAAIGVVYYTYLKRVEKKFGKVLDENESRKVEADAQYLRVLESAEEVLEKK